MRIHIKTTGSTELLPFNYQPILTGAIHKWLDKNILHSNISLYSFSWLNGGTASKSGIKFNEGASFFISVYDGRVLEKIIGGIKNDPIIAKGLKVVEVVLQENPVFYNETVFFAASPVLVKRTEDNQEIHYTWNNLRSDNLLTETMKNKLKKAGLSTDGIFVGFDRSFHSPKTKVIYYNKIGNRANICPVIIKGAPEQIAFAWNVGAGNSTGIGFGALK